MNSPDPLANLQPLRPGELIGWWPLAPGWWMLLTIAIVAVAVLAYLLRKRYRRNTYRREALRRLSSLHCVYETERDTGNYITQLNALLKSVALRVYPPEQVAATHGAPWRTFLNQNLPPALQLHDEFDTAAYQKTCPDIDVAQVQLAAQHWIKKHKAAR